MPLEQSSSIDQITIEFNGVILLRTNTIVTDGTTQIAQSYARTSLVPGQDLTGQPTNVVSIANAVWTPAVVSAYQASQTPKIGASAAPSA